MSIVNPEAPLRVALFEPRIPPNTGNIARTCAAFQLPLSLIVPLGLQIDDRSLRRAGLDYWPHVQVSTHGSFDALKDKLLPHNRIIGCSRRGGSCLSEFEFKHGDVLLFGREDTGLPEDIRGQCHSIVRIPVPGAAAPRGERGVSSHNLSVASALVTYVAGHQLRLW